MIVDAHHHVWDLAVRAQDWIAGPELEPLRRTFTVEELQREAAAAGVDATVLVQTVTVARETPEFLELAASSPLIAGVVGWTDLTSRDVGENLARLAGTGPLVGIRHQVQAEPDPRWLVRPEALRGLQAVASAGLVYDLVVLPHQLPAAVEVAAAVPELTFVLDHLGKPPIAAGEPEPWARDVRALAELPNTVCKLSGMVTEADWRTWTVEALRPFADTVLEAFGPDRLMFGSDWPVCLVAASYADVLKAAVELTASLGPDEQAAVLGGTAARVYGLSGEGVPEQR
ncbi:amidohydrolase [Wenjunlia tyrosinilytica]|uniref:Amidohydrolase n=1 Tax=Wenjunlia tyrosinilytica TaxID=1544741 RepID=A0A917ZSA0_9ACTN|nr:amidohydrolase family protein [Wenjunlia tyrosinilytica]GGO92502.1 amidohydrolase [Wenjunlia tyrosinilytica]